MPADTAVLRIDRLDFSYPRRPVLTDWSAEFAAGLVWLQGRNGCGKSTLLALIAGALPPRAGRLAVRGIDAAREPIAYRREVFWCGPGAAPFDHLRAPEYFGFLRGLYPRFDPRALDEAIDGFNLAADLHKPLAALSTGTQRKALLAAALAAGTAVGLFDEPFNALDASSAAFLRQALARLAREADRAWLIASHEPVEADRVLSLDAPRA